MHWSSDMVAFILFGAVLTGGALPPEDIDGQSAIEIVTSFAHRVGYHGKLGLNSVGPVDGKRWGFGSGEYQAVGLALPDKRWLNGYVSPSGRIQLFQVSQPEVGQSRGTQRTTKPAIIQMAKKLIQATGASGNFQMRAVQLGQTDPYAMVYFDIVVGGHKFLNLNPTYAYRLDFNANTGEVSYFSRPPAIPEVVATKPSVSAAKAMALLDRWGKTHYQSGRGSVYLYGPSWHYTPTLVPEIGYYKFAKEEKARLVWEAHIWTHFVKSEPLRESGELRVYVDAVTGQLIETDDQLMG